jgi:PKD repeat protein
MKKTRVPTDAEIRSQLDQYLRATNGVDVPPPIRDITAMSLSDRPRLARLLFGGGVVLALAVATTVLVLAAHQPHPVAGAARPTAALTLTPTSGIAPFTVEANASGSSPARGSSIATYTFDFGDGTVVGPQKAPTAFHTYPKTNEFGAFVVSVVVTDSDGARSVAIADESAPGPEVSIADQWSDGPLPITVSVDASGSSGPVPISTYTFNFGDGTTIGPQTGPTAEHAYTAAGTYTITVTVVDQRGNSAQGSDTVNLSTVVPTSPGTPRVVPTPLPTPTSTAGWVRVSDPAGGFSFEIPSSWKVSGPCTSPGQPPGDPEIYEVNVGPTAADCGSDVGFNISAESYAGTDTDYLSPSVPCAIGSGYTGATSPFISSITVDGVQGTRCTIAEANDSDLAYIYAYYFVNGDHVYAIWDRQNQPGTDTPASAANADLSGFLDMIVTQTWQFHS